MARPTTTTRSARAAMIPWVRSNTTPASGLWRNWLLALVSTISGMLANSALIGAQQPTTDSVLSETNKLLKALQGTWAVTEHYDGGGKGKGAESWRPGPGNRSVVEEYHSVDDHGKAFTGLAIGWWDDQANGFRITWCDNQEGCRLLSASWESGAWVARDTSFEEVFSDITPTSFTQTLYVGTPGDTKRLMTIKAKRLR
jgi:hypothetical protein